MGAGRILGVEDYGRYTIVITVTLLVANLIGAGLPIALGKFLSAYRSDGQFALAQKIKKKVALWQFVFMMLVGGAFFLLSPILAMFLGDPTLTSLFMMSSLIIPLYGADLFYFHYYSGLKRFDVQSWLKFFRAILRISVILGLAYWFHLEGMIAGYLLVPLFVFLLAWGIDMTFLRKKSMQEQENPSKKQVFSLKKVFHLAGYTVAFLVLFEILVSFDIYIIKYLTGDDSVVGNYSAALTIARIPTFLFYALTIILLPTISEAKSLKNTRRAKEILSLAFRYMLVVTVPLITVLMAYSEWLPVFLFGPEFAGASTFLLFLGLALGMLTLLYVFGFAFVGAGKGKIPVLIGGGALLINGVIAGILYGVWGILGVAFAKIFAGIFVVISILIASKSIFSLTVLWRDVVEVLVFSILLYCGFSLMGQNIWSFFIGIPVLFFFYLIFLWMVGVISKRDFEVLRKKA